MSTVDVRNEDRSAAIVCDFALRGVKERGKRDAKKDRNNELFHAFGALTVGKRAFLIRSFKFFPSVDRRQFGCHLVTRQDGNNCRSEYLVEPSLCRWRRRRLQCDAQDQADSSRRRR